MLESAHVVMKGESKSWSFSFGEHVQPVSRDVSGEAMRVDVMEKDGNLIVQADVPGIPEEDIDLEMSASSFKLTAKQPCPAREEAGVRMWLEERACSRTTKTVSLPFDVDPDQVNAVLEEGVLTITAPKVEGTDRNRVSTKSVSKR